ncbi:MAG: methylated-DNA--[protein]-cysteine S-methyltransferase [Fimbriimonadales bacterium]
MKSKHFDSPLGSLYAESSDVGITKLLFIDGRQADRQTAGPGESPHLDACAKWLAAYWEGDFAGLPAVAIDPKGTGFEQAVWTELLAIAPGTTRSYSRVAEIVGCPAARAVGTAVGKNPLALVVPCHRVIGANGSLTGYAAGLHRKEWLLKHEGALSGQLPLF